MNTSNQHNLNIGTYGCALYKRIQRLGFWKKGVRRHVRKKEQDLKTSLGWQPTPESGKCGWKAV